MKLRVILFSACILIIIAILSLIPIQPQAHKNEAPYKMDLLNPVYHQLLDSAKFVDHGVCEGCHGPDDTLRIALIDSAGNDVNIYYDWRSSMMALSAKDPFWRAKVSHEVLVNPAHGEVLENTCISCHAPLGRITAMLAGHDSYTMDDLLQDTLGLDGITCGACHQISPFGLQNSYSGVINYDTNKIMYGPYPFPFDAPMRDFIGFEPRFSEHIVESELCAGCHTLFVGSVDLDGNPTGEIYIEQATYHEWKNSRYSEEFISCQSCHMPRIEDSIIIASGILDLDPRSPFGLHEMAGSNVFMLKLMKENREKLDIEARDEHFDETIAATYRLLQDESMDITLEVTDVDGDTLKADLTLASKVGHKFPTGYPSRRIIVQFMVITEMGDTIFFSGKMDNEYALIEEDPDFEPHHNTIRSEEQVQIYETANGDVTGAFTTILERAYVVLKDNRLPPDGFTTTHQAYDTTRIAGNAENDPDFNKGPGGEGTGADVVHFHVPTGGFEGVVDIKARVLFHSLPPKWMAELFSASTPEIDSFKQMFFDMDNEPVLIGEAGIEDFVIETTGIETDENHEVRVYPNPATEKVIIEGGKYRIRTVEVLTIDGKIVNTIRSLTRRIEIELPDEKGIYLIRLEMDATGVTKTFQVIKK